MYFQGTVIHEELDGQQHPEREDYEETVENLYNELVDVFLSHYSPSRLSLKVGPPFPLRSASSVKCTDR